MVLCQVSQKYSTANAIQILFSSYLAELRMHGGNDRAASQNPPAQGSDSARTARCPLSLVFLLPAGLAHPRRLSRRVCVVPRSATVRPSLRCIPLLCRPHQSCISSGTGQWRRHAAPLGAPDSTAERAKSGARVDLRVRTERRSTPLQLGAHSRLDWMCCCAPVLRHSSPALRWHPRASDPSPPPCLFLRCPPPHHPHSTRMQPPVQRRRPLQLLLLPPQPWSLCGPRRSDEFDRSSCQSHGR